MKDRNMIEKFRVWDNIENQYVNNIGITSNTSIILWVIVAF